jgi:hypothetical protein
MGFSNRFSFLPCTTCTSSSLPAHSWHVVNLGSRQDTVMRHCHSHAPAWTNDYRGSIADRSYTPAMLTITSRTIQNVSDVRCDIDKKSVLERSDAKVRGKCRGEVYYYRRYAFAQQASCTRATMRTFDMTRKVCCQALLT